ncbi:MAG TPA: hypothetical protein DDY32_19675 [Desulfobulbaceae bacterium]|nr:hypothetical protein [Desulfobulbaceae bacterium]
MKTSAFLIYASILLVFVYLFTMRIQVDEEDDMARFIPQTVLLYLEQQERCRCLETVCRLTVWSTVLSLLILRL